MNLKLGALPNSDVVRLTLTLPAALKAQLDLYAELHSSQHGKTVDAQSLIPRILEVFLDKDREFQRHYRSRGKV